MVRKSALATLALTAWLVVPALAQERERTMPTRAFDRFELESETVNGFWAETGGLYQWADEGRATTAFARFALGGNNDKCEADLFVPYSDRKGDIGSENGLGDIRLSGKYIPIRGGVLDLGAGVEASLPSGDHTRGLGAGELGGLLFATGAIHLGIADLRGHVGPEFFSGSAHQGLASDRLVYGFGIHMPLGKYLALRNELSGVDVYDMKDGPKVVNYVPGLDLRIPVGNLDVLVRATGTMGVTTEAPAWGAGGSLVITSPTMRAPASPGTGGVVVE
jgi:hypothetical protein